MVAGVCVLVRRASRALRYLAVALLVFLAATGAALACVGPAEPTTTTTSLSGESKSGASITVLEGSKVKDQATLEGKNAAKATGKISYAIYADSSCKELVTKAGESEFTGGKVPASEEKTLEGGKVYYWQAHYGGDSLDAESTSSCGSEVLTVKAATTTSATLVAEGEESVEGAEISVMEGTPVKVKATVSGANIAKATGSVKYAVYADAKCKELVVGAGEGIVEGTKVGSSEAINLEGEATYYVMASFTGGPLHQPSATTCGNQILVVKIFKYRSTAYPVNNAGETFSGSTEFFEFNGSIVKCFESTYTSTLLVGPSETLRILPAAAFCDGFKTSFAEFLPNGCEYELGKPRKIGFESFAANNVNIVCPPTKKMIFRKEDPPNGIECEIQVGPQNGVGKFELLNLFGPPKSVRIEPKLTNFAYSVTISVEPVECGGLNVENRNDGIYEGKFGLPLTKEEKSKGELYVG